MPFLSVGRTEIYYETYGEPQSYTVILIHPIGGNILIWKDEIELLSKNGFRVIAYEQRGHHRTDIGRIKAYAIQELVQDLRLLLEHLKIEKCTLVGHSIGGIIASLYAAQYSANDNIDGIVLINSSPKKIPEKDLEKHFKTREIAITRGIEALAEFTLKEDKQSQDMAKSDRDAAFFREVFAKTSVGGFVAATLALYSIPENVTPTLRSLRCKIVGIVGSEDDVFLRLLKETREEIPKLELHVISESDHWLVIEKPKTMHDILMKFLQTVVSGENT